MQKKAKVDMVMQRECVSERRKRVETMVGQQGHLIIILSALRYRGSDNRLVWPPLFPLAQRRKEKNRKNRSAWMDAWAHLGPSGRAAWLPDQRGSTIVPGWWETSRGRGVSGPMDPVEGHGRDKQGR